MVIGLTGHSGSGKTTAARVFESFGFLHIDCDKMVHNEIYTDSAVVGAIKAAFGKDTVLNGTVNRKALAKIIFSDKTEYNKLMSLVKPFIEAALVKKISAGEKVLLDAPSLFELGLQGLCDITVGIVSDNAIPRITARDNISEAEARSRLDNQQSPEFYESHCDYVIKNNGTLIELTSSVIQIIKKGGLN